MKTRAEILELEAIQERVREKYNPGWREQREWHLQSLKESHDLRQQELERKKDERH